MTTVKREVIIYTMNDCPWCDKAKELLADKNIGIVQEWKVGEHTEGSVSKKEFKDMAARLNWSPATVPMIFDANDQKLIGGYNDLAKWIGLT